MGRTIVAASFAVWVAGVFAGSMFALDLWPQPLEDLWYSSARIVVTLAFAVAVGAYVGPWSLVTALAPLVPAIPLQLAGHVAPWESAWRPLDVAPWYAVVLLVTLSVGAVARQVAGRDGRLATS